MSATMRPYVGEADYAPVRHLYDVVTGASPLHYGTAGDLDWWRFAHEDPDVLRHTALWCAGDGTIVGFAWPKGDEAEVESHPAHRDLEGAIFAWAEAQAASQSPPASLIATRCFDEDAPRVATLRARGYVRLETEQAYRYRSRALSGELPERVVPPGFTVRALGGDDELAARVAVHRAAFAPSRMTIEKHRSVRTAPGYRPDLDLVAVAPDGTFGAYCIVWFDPVNRLGVFEPVGADPTWQRRGLARAVLIEGFYRLRALGATTAFVACRRDNALAAALYEAVGFRTVGKDHRWEKALGGVVGCLRLVEKNGGTGLVRLDSAAEEGGTMAISTEDAAALCARVYALVRACPRGRVTSYGAIGKVLGHPRGARMIGWIMNETPDRADVPAQRVIGKDGTLTGAGLFGGEAAMRALLEGEGVTFDEKGRAIVKVHAWDPSVDLAPDALAQLLADAPVATPVEPSAGLMRLLNRDVASPFSKG